MQITTKRLLNLGALMLVFLFTSVLVQAQNERADVTTPPNGVQTLSQLPITTLSYTGTITNTDNTQADRLNRNLVASSCVAPKVCDIFATGPFFYDVHTFVNPEPGPLCVDLTMDGTCTDGNLQLNAYLGSYDPMNICTNYLGDPGMSTGIPITPYMYSVEIPAGQTLVMVVHDTNVGGTCEAGGGYEVTLSGDFTIAPPPIPTMGEWGIMILGMLFLIIGVVSVRRKVLSMN
jgi:hypothetical protein